jgi:Flp pilus assembly pilin Flp
MRQRSASTALRHAVDRYCGRKVTEVPKVVLRALPTRVPLRSGERGQTFSEYAVALAAITMGIFAALVAFSGAIKAAFDAVNATVSGILS